MVQSTTNFGNVLKLVRQLKNTRVEGYKVSKGLADYFLQQGLEMRKSALLVPGKRTFLPENFAEGVAKLKQIGKELFFVATFVGRREMYFDEVTIKVSAIVDDEYVFYVEGELPIKDIL